MRRVWLTGFGETSGLRLLVCVSASSSDMPTSWIRNAMTSVAERLPRDPRRYRQSQNAMTRARCAPPPLVTDHVAPRAEPRWARSCASAIASSPPSPRAARRVRTARRVHERGAATDDRREPRRREEARGPYLMPAEQWTRHARFALHAPETNAETCGAAGQRARAITDRARRYRSRTSRRAGRCGGNAPGGAWRSSRTRTRASLSARAAVEAGRPADDRLSPRRARGFAGKAAARSPL